MAQFAIKPVDEAPGAIDRAHLTRMSFGDRNLERELLQLFDRQASLLIGRIRNSDAAAVRTLAHTLKGSALGVGAFDVAHAAKAVEQAPPFALGAAVEQLARAIQLTQGTIAAMLPGGETLEA